MFPNYSQVMRSGGSKYAQNKPFLLYGCFFILLIIAYMDYLTGYDIRAFVLYYLLIFFVTINFGRNWGFAFLVLCEIAGLSTILLFQSSLLSPEANYWNALIRLVILTIIVDVTSRLKTGLERENKLRLQIEDQNRKLYEVNRDLRNLTYSIVHDIKNPITVISAFCDILKEAEPTLNLEQKDALSRIISQNHRIYEIVNDLLRLVRIGAQELMFTDVNLSEIAASIVDKLRFMYPNTKFEVSIQPQMKIYGDAGLINLLLTNLIGNAMKFTMKSDNPKIRIGVADRTEVNAEKLYFVKDNGVGFDHEKSQKIFEPFVRLHSPKDFSGTGIGLAIVKRIIEKHKGKIWASSEPGKGTTFYFTLRTESR